MAFPLERIKQNTAVVQATVRMIFFFFFFARKVESVCGVEVNINGK